MQVLNLFSDRHRETPIAPSPWKIPADTPDWECDWRGDQLFHLRHFRSFPLPEKIRAIEEMQQVAEFLARKGRKPIPGSDSRQERR